MDELNEMNNLSKADQEMLDRVEKITSHKVAPVSPADELYLRLTNTVTPAPPAFRQQLETRLLEELSRQVAVESSSTAANTLPVINKEEIRQAESISTARVQQNLQRRKKLLNWKKAAKLRTEVSSEKRGWPWQKLVLAGMAAVTIIFVLGIIGLATLNIGEEISSGNPQPASNGSPTVSQSQPAKTELAGNQIMVLQPTSPKVSADQLEAARQIMQQRINALNMGNAAVKVQDSKIILEIPNGAVAAQFMEKFGTQLKIVISTGRLEVVDAGNSVLTAGEVVQTTYCTSGTMSDKKPDLCNSNGQTGKLNEAGQPFRTLFTNEQLDPTRVEQINGAGGVVALQLAVQSQTLDTIKKYASINPASQIAVLQDRQVLTELPIKAALANQLEVPIASGNSKDKLNSDSALALFIKYGALPFDLEVVSHL